MKYVLSALVALCAVTVMADTIPSGYDPSQLQQEYCSTGRSVPVYDQHGNFLGYFCAPSPGGGSSGG